MVFSVQIKLSFKCIKRSQKDRTKDDRVTYQKCSKATIKKQTHEDDDDETTPYQVATGAPKFERYFPRPESSLGVVIYSDILPCGHNATNPLLAMI